jgi:hypothetical protein
VGEKEMPDQSKTITTADEKTNAQKVNLSNLVRRKADSEGRVYCAKCDTLPEIVKHLGDSYHIGNESPEYRLECKCGDKNQPTMRSQFMAIQHWESVGFSA